MKVLALDTTTSYLSVALCDGVRVLEQRTEACERAHAERLLPIVESILAGTHTKLDSVELLAVTVGPGSFTGVRIGLAHWKGLALALRLPLMGVSTLDALARQSGVSNGHLCALMDAKMDEVFAAHYRFLNGERTRTLDETACSIEAALHGVPDGATFLGDGAARYAESIVRALPHAIILPAEQGVLLAATVAAEALDCLRRGVPGDPALVVPVYLRQSQPEELRRKKEAARPTSV